MEESWYDAAFARRWTNGTFLLNTTTHNVVTEADLSGAGAKERYVVWDEASNQPIIYDPATGNYDRDGVTPALFGARSVKDKNGASFRASRFLTPGDIAAGSPGASRKFLGCRGESPCAVVLAQPP